jgi:3-oxoadipate CoA-transferase alpha subunit
MIDKTAVSLAEVLSQIRDGAAIMIGGFGAAVQPAELMGGLIDLDCASLTPRALTGA